MARHGSWGWGFHKRGVVALPGYSVFLLPWTGYKATGTAWSSRQQLSTYLGGGHLFDAGTQNDTLDNDVWLDAGTYKVAVIYPKGTDAGIFTINFNAASQGTVDSYASPATDNNYSEVTGLAVTAGVKTVQLKMATKNASSSGYIGRIQSIALIRTGA